MSQNLVTSFKNTADLRTHQYKAAYVSAAMTASLVTSADQNCVGVIQDKVNANEGVTLCTYGWTKMKAGGSITAGNKLKTDTSGTFVAATSGDVVFGTAIETVNSGDIFRGIFAGGLQTETTYGA